MEEFLGYHSEWNLGSPGGWDYQRTTQEIGKRVWNFIKEKKPIPLDLDFDHPLLYPVEGFARMLVRAAREREGKEEVLIAVVAEEETLDEVTENINLARKLDSMPGVSAALVGPREFELVRGRTALRGRPVSLIFMDFNTDVLITLHRKHDLSPLLAAVRENRVINPRGTEPINVKSMFEALTGPERDRFPREIVRRTPWTRKFFPRKTQGPVGEAISDLVEWTRRNWERLVLKPERGYSGKGVRVGGVNPEPDEAIELALKQGGYIVQEKIPLHLWAEEIPALDRKDKSLRLSRVQTDFRCLVGPDEVFGFLCRFGGVPTNVGSGGGVQPLAVLRSDLPVSEAVKRINDAILSAGFETVACAQELQEKMALEQKFTYLLGPIKIALRPRLVRPGQLEALTAYARAMWESCLLLERMWMEGALGHLADLEQEELDLARAQPWQGSPAIIASDGLFSFGAHPASD